MKKIKLLALVVCALALVSPVSAQSECVKVKFEVDGKEVDQEFRVLLYVGNKVIEPTFGWKEFCRSARVEGTRKAQRPFLIREVRSFF